MATVELRKIHILANLTDAQLAALATFGEILPVAAGQIIICQGERADAMFMLISGKVAAHAKGKAGNESHLRSTEAGGHFGEIGLLEEGVRTASVRAESACRVFRLNKESFRKILQQPELATPLLYSRHYDWPTSPTGFPRRVRSRMRGTCEWTR